MNAETVRSRFVKTMHGELPADRLPLLEWAPWWDATLEVWRQEGLDTDRDLRPYFGLDVETSIWVTLFKEGKCPVERKKTPGSICEYWIESEADYDALRPHLFPDPVPFDRAALAQIAARQEAGETYVYYNFIGFFWWPRDLLGVEPHLYAFYDHPRLMHRINQDLAEYYSRAFETLLTVCVPDFVKFGEDMAYNHGPMISKALFDEFIAPYYRQVLPAIKSRGAVPIVDCDGFIEPLIPWFEEVGMEGSLPLERMAGVDVNRIRANHPRWRMIGGFDKTVMHLGEDRIRAEFERLLPVMRSGYFVPSVDHQTPLAVRVQDYQLYLQLLREYGERACR